jgi:tetratricopeptide (TPR) repeat protein
LLLFLILLNTAAVFAQPAGSAAAFYNRGQALMAEEEWYAASEAFLECLKINAAHAEGTAALAACYYELGEYDQSLSWVRRARSLARSDMSLANLEASVLVALGRLDDAQVLVDEVLRKEPYNREAVFVAAELEIARGHTGNALTRIREVSRRFPDDRRVLVSLALVSGSLGDAAGAKAYIDRAMLLHSEDYRVYYYAAYLDSRAGRLSSGIHNAEEALSLRPQFAPALSLLASLRYRSGEWEEAARLADEAIARDRGDSSSWYLRGMAYARMGRSTEAMTILSTAAAINGSDEFIRSALEELFITGTAVEDPSRGRWAAWHFNRARDFRARNMNGEALFEYRRGLRLNPYALDRREYAEILRRQGYPSRYIEELKFLQSLGLEKLPPNEVRAINDSVEAYESVLSDTLYRRWSVEGMEVARRHWKVAVFSQANQAAFHHADAGLTASSYVRDLLVHDRNIEAMDLPLNQSDFSHAWRTAREAGADYFLIVSIAENERDLSLTGELFVGRTGAGASNFYSYRTGLDRLRNASRGIVEQLSAALPFRGVLLRRRANQGLLDKGKADGVALETVYDVIKKGRTTIRNEGIGLIYAPEDVVGAFTVERVDEEVSSGSLTRTGFFDRIEAGDEIVAQKTEETESAALPTPANPELGALLRALR